MRGERHEHGGVRAAVCRDRGFVASLRRGRNPRLGTVDRALAVMGEPPAGPAFRGEVEAFLAVTGVKRSLLGREATGNPPLSRNCSAACRRSWRRWKRCARR